MQHNSKTISLKHALKKKGPRSIHLSSSTKSMSFSAFVFWVQTFALLEDFGWKFNDSIEKKLQDVKRNLKNLQIASDFYTWFK